MDRFWLRKYTPPTCTSQRTVGVYFHGGGWAMGSVDQEDALCRFISKECQMTVHSVGYRLAPKYKYPAALDDCVGATSWAFENHAASEVVLIGASAGGNLAFGTALRLIDRGMGDKVKGVVALVPVTIHPDAVADEMKAQYTSYEEHAENTVNTKSAMMTFWELYGPPPFDIHASCLLHPQLRKLKKVYIAECGTDTLRDDARLMKEELDKAGVRVRYDTYPGFPHYSWTFPSNFLDEHRSEFLGNVLEAVRWVNSE